MIFLNKVGYIWTEKNKIKAYNESYQRIVLREGQFFEQEVKELGQINLNNTIERTAASTAVNKNIIAKIQSIEDVLNRKKQPGIPVPNPNYPVIPKNFSFIIQQFVRETYLERERIQTLDSILKRLNQKTKDFDHLNLFTGDEILDRER